MNIKLLSSLEKCFLDDNINDKCEYKKASCFNNEIFRFEACYNSDEFCSRGRCCVDIKSNLKQYITVRKIEQVPVQMPVEDDKFDDNYLRTSPGLYPDILLPLGKFNRVALSRNLHSLFVEVALDGNVKGGIYPIEIIFSDESGKSTIGSAVFELEVIPASLPEQETIFTQWFHCDCLQDYYGTESFDKRHWKIIESFMRTAVKNGINMILTPVFTPPLDTYVGGERTTTQLVDVEYRNGEYSFDFTRLGKWVELCKKIGIKYFEIAHLFTQWGAKHAPKIVGCKDGIKTQLFGWETDALSEEYAEFLACFIPQLIAFMKELGVDKQCIFHLSDEPPKDGIEQYKSIRKIVEPLLEGYIIADALSEYDYYAEGLVAMPIPVISSAEKFISNNVPNLWTYYCCEPTREYSNRFNSMPSARNRILGLQLYKFDIKGFLHWGYNFYNNMFSYDNINPYLCNDGENFTCAGDCFSVYPARDGTAYESIRLAVFHDALQDIRALKLCESLYSKEYVMNIAEENIPPLTLKNYPHTAEYILNVREKINAAVKQALSNI